MFDLKTFISCGAAVLVVMALFTLFVSKDADNTVHFHAPKF